MKKITMMDNLTLFIDKREHKIEIDDKFTKATRIDEIEDLEHSLPGFFDVETISRQDNKYYLIYNLPAGYESLEKAKHLVPVVKLQLIKNLLESDPLLESDGMTYLDLNNIFYKNFSDVKVLYRSNGLLPYHKGINNLEQYKLFVLGFFSDKFSYKRFLVNKDHLLQKENKEFMFAINAVRSFAELKALVAQELEKEHLKFYEKVQLDDTGRRKKVKRKLYIGSFVVIMLILVFVGGLKQEKKHIAEDFKQELAAQKADNELTRALSSGDTDTAEKLMKAKGEGRSAIANMLLKSGKYDDAIAYDKPIQKKVVAYLYKIGQQDKISDLKSNSSFLTYEKDIVNFDAKEDDLVSKASLIQDKDTLKRLGLTLMRHEDFEDAKEVLERLKDDNSETFHLSRNEKVKIGQYIKKTDLELKIKDLNEQISDLQQDNLFDDGDSSTKDAQVNSLEDKVENVQKTLVKLDEKLGMDE